MRCPHCNALNASTARVCRQCSEQLPASKSGLQTELLVRGGDSTQENLDDTIVSMTGSILDRSKKHEGPLLGDRYKMMEQLGRGGFATVHRAYDTRLKRPVAIKTLLPGYLASPAADLVLTRFGAEASIIAQLKHPNIVEVYDYHHTDNTFYLVMEFIDGPTLDEIVKEHGNFNVVEALTLVRGIAKGLFYAHRNNLVHRDIKPSNVILTTIDGVTQPKIVDFGLAGGSAETSEVSRTGFGMGTPGYMAPEQGADAKNVDHRADIYSLGKLLYVLLTGEKAQDVIPTVIPDPPFLSRIIFNCIRPRVESRYFSLEGFLDDVNRALGQLKTQESTLSMIQENTCPSCKARNEPEDGVCLNCGHNLRQTCPECGKDNSIHNRTCPGCRTDQAAFLQISRGVREARAAGEGSRWQEMNEVFAKLPEHPALPGARGHQLLAHVQELRDFVNEQLTEADELKSQLHVAIAAGNPSVALDTMRRYQAIIPNDHEVNALHDFLAEEKRIGAFVDGIGRARAELQDAHLESCRQLVDRLTPDRKHPAAMARSQTVDKWAVACREFDALAEDLEASERSVEHLISQAAKAMDLHDYDLVQRLCLDIRGISTQNVEADRIRQRAENLVIQASQNVMLARKALVAENFEEAVQRAQNALAIQRGNSEAQGILQDVKERERQKRTKTKVVAISTAALIVVAIVIALAVKTSGSADEAVAELPNFSSFDQALAEASEQLERARRFPREPVNLMVEARKSVARAAEDAAIGGLDRARRSELASVKSDLRAMSALLEVVRRLEARQEAGETDAIQKEVAGLLDDKNTPVWCQKRLRALVKVEAEAFVAQDPGESGQPVSAENSLHELESAVRSATRALQLHLPNELAELQERVQGLKDQQDVEPQALRAETETLHGELKSMIAEAKRRSGGILRFRDAITKADGLLSELRRARDVRHQKEIAGKIVDLFSPGVLRFQAYMSAASVKRYRSIERQARIVIDSPIPKWDEAWREARNTVSLARRDSIEERDPSEPVLLGMRQIRKATDQGMPMELAHELYIPLFRMQLGFLMSDAAMQPAQDFRGWMRLATRILDAQTSKLEEHFDLPGLTARTLPKGLRPLSWKIPRGISHEGRSWYLLYPAVVQNSLQTMLCLVPPGDFIMGTHGGPAEEGPEHRVTMSNPFYMSMFEIQQGAYRAFSAERLNIRLGSDDDTPVPVQSIVEAMRYCNWVSALSKLPSSFAGMPDQPAREWRFSFDSESYRLPTEAEWEYAARYNNAHGRDTAWNADRSGGTLLAPTKDMLEVTRTVPNPLGIFLMRGNLREWVCDWYRPYLDSEQTDPVVSYFGDSEDSGRLITRGGSYESSVEESTATGRHRIVSNRLAPEDTGLRLVLPAPIRLPAELED